MDQGKSMKQTHVKGMLGGQQRVNLECQNQIFGQESFYKCFVTVFNLQTNTPLPASPFEE